MSIINRLLCLSVFLSVNIVSHCQGLFENSLSENESSSYGSLQIGGDITNFIYTGMDEDKNIVFPSISSRAAIRMEASAGKFARAYLEFRYRYGNEYNRTISIPELREAYTSIDLGPVFIRAGKQVLNSGMTSFINPTDVYNPVDPAHRSPDADDLRLSIWALRTKVAITAQSEFSATWLPVYRPSSLLTDPFDFPGYIQFSSDFSPEISIKNSGFHLEYSMRNSMMDLGISFYHGYRNNPSIMIDTLVMDFQEMQPALLELYRKPYLVNASGLNLAIPFGSYIFRGEYCWMDRPGSYSKATPNPEMSWAAELEQSGGNATIAMGYYGKYIMDYEKTDGKLFISGNDFPGIDAILPSGAVLTPDVFDDVINRQIILLNSLYNYQVEEFYHAAYALLDIGMMNDKLGFRVPVMYNFTSGELTLLPSFEIKPSDGLSILFGSYFLHGPEKSLYELAGPVLNSFYARIRISF